MTSQGQLLFYQLSKKGGVANFVTNTAIATGQQGTTDALSLSQGSAEVRLLTYKVQGRVFFCFVLAGCVFWFFTPAQRIL